VGHQNLVKELRKNIAGEPVERAVGLRAMSRFCISRRPRDEVVYYIWRQFILPNYGEHRFMLRKFQYLLSLSCVIPG
jgi:hypothetical protein